ncbi:malonyl-CoA decarboxylase [Granulosicoccus antarcticus]|uniref:Malonyl-CoA decarboxylase n=1 Tax=Granulosicoccus antarcticus IMCC3135 TaxID=1192854 RepID=A0A2Z2NRQ9_9GAMM|nr:malonyl-CoA decarboxylase [Granulosicoccus antarcticus]ASJ73929.1 hypothetical protein IMCC3135_19250 [Granulosicoccus antarcticus IMCC3135]
MARQNISFLHDLLQTIGDRVRPRAVEETSDIAPLLLIKQSCEQLMHRSGEVSRISVAAQALDAYSRLDSEDRVRFFRMLLEDYSVDAEAVRSAFEHWNSEGTESALAALVTVVEPRRQQLLRQLNMAPGGTLQLVRLRADLLQAIRVNRELAPLDADFSHLLASWFNRGFLVMRRIDWDSPASVLEKIVAYEAVHKITGWDDLRRRLDPADRRCYGFFHPATGDEPLIFVEVAICTGIPAAIGPLLESEVDARAIDADTAVFYSISNCQPGLKGVSFGNFLIKQVVADLSKDLPELTTFVTLSPAPGFANWLAAEQSEEAQTLSAFLREGRWQTDTELQQQLAPGVQAWATRYFIEAKNGSGIPVDPVTRFHIGNGALAHRVNWPADFADGALQRGHGVMINYLYELDGIEARHEAFAENGSIACGPDVEQTLQREGIKLP